MHNTGTQLNTIPCAKWTNDCQGKKDYDGRLISVSSCFWPTNYSSKGLYSAISSIVLNIGPPDNYGYGESLKWNEMEFEGFTEQEVKMKVEVWVEEQMLTIIRLMGGIEKFKK